MSDDILDELLAMAEQLQCCGPDPENWNAYVEECMQRNKQTSERQRWWNKEICGTEEPLPLRCPHCMMLKRLRALKAEAEQFAREYAQTRRYIEGV